MMLDRSLQGVTAASHIAADAGAIRGPLSKRTGVPPENGNFAAIIDTYMALDVFALILICTEPKLKKPAKARARGVACATIEGSSLRISGGGVR
jgi:hypothetical protein